jgi:hypothetical protein
VCLEPSYSSKTPNYGLHVFGRSYSRSSIAYTTATFNRRTLGKVFEGGDSSRRHKPLSQPPVRGRFLPSEKLLLSKVFSFLKLWQKGYIYDERVAPQDLCVWYKCATQTPCLFKTSYTHVWERRERWWHSSAAQISKFLSSSRFQCEHHSLIHTLKLYLISRHLFISPTAAIALAMWCCSLWRSAVFTWKIIFFT